MASEKRIMHRRPGHPPGCPIFSFSEKVGLFGIGLKSWRLVKPLVLRTGILSLGVQCMVSTAKKSNGEDERPVAAAMPAQPPAAAW